MSRQVNTIGMTIAQALEANGQAGATHMGTGFDAWYPGYIDYMPMLQNINAFWTETALYRYATPHFYTLDDFPRDMRDLRPQSLYPSPWAGGWWRLKDAVDYMVTASIATLDYAAKYREELLYNRYQAGRNAIAAYAAEPPYAYVDSAGAARSRARRSRCCAASRSTACASASSTATSRSTARRYRRGTWVIPMDQEFAELVRQLFEVQEYPDLREYPEGPPEQPYDAAGWTLPFQMDVNVVEVRTPLAAEARAALRPVRGKPTDWRASADAPFSTDSIAAGIVAPAATITGSGDRLAVDPGAEQRVHGSITRRSRPAARCASRRRATGRARATSSSGVADGARSRDGRATCRCAPSATSLGGAGVPAARLAHRAVQAVDREHGRGVDGVAARPVRLQVHGDRAGRRARRRPRVALRRDPHGVATRRARSRTASASGTVPRALCGRRWATSARGRSTRSCAAAERWCA